MRNKVRQYYASQTWEGLVPGYAFEAETSPGWHNTASLNLSATGSTAYLMDDPLHE